VLPLSSSSVAVEKRGVEQAKASLAEHLAEPVLLMDRATAVGLSPFYLLQTFKHAAGLPLHGYLNQLCVEHARVLLRCDAPPAPAAALSFVDQSHLTRRFKAACGVTPGQYASAQRD
jgi:AraC-like DNA-binding protein